MNNKIKLLLAAIEPVFETLGCLCVPDQLAPRPKCDCFRCACARSLLNAMNDAKAPLTPAELDVHLRELLTPLLARVVTHINPENPYLVDLTPELCHQHNSPPSFHWKSYVGDGVHVQGPTLSEFFRAVEGYKPREAQLAKLQKEKAALEERIKALQQ